MRRFGRWQSEGKSPRDWEFSRSMSDFKPGAKVGRNTNPNFCCGLNESGRTCGFRNFKKAAFETHGKVVVQPPRTCR